MFYNNKQVDIYEGLIVKNYKEMCQLLDEKITGGNSKKAQLNNWKRYFDFQKDGQKFIITKIYTKPLPMSKAEKIRGGMYVRDIECLLVDLINKSNGSLTISKNCLYNKLGLTNDKYANFYRTAHDSSFIIDDDNNDDDKEDKTSQADFVNEIITFVNNRGVVIEEDCFKENCIKTPRGNMIPIQDKDIVRFYQTVNTKLSVIFSRALYSMEKHNIIKSYQGYEIAIKTGNKNKNGKERVKIRPATNEECAIITDIKKQALDKIGCVSGFDVGCKHLWRKYQSVIDELTTERFADWAFFYPVYTFVRSENFNTVIRTKSISRQRLDLNKKVIQALEIMYDNKLQNSRQRYEEAKKTCVDEWGQVIKEKLPYRLPLYYPVQQKLIMDELIKIDNNEQ